jgi:peptide/nickel transport system permease protein
VGRYAIQRVMLGVVTVWLVTLFVFFALRLVVPIFYADITDIILGEYAGSDPVLQERLRDEYGLSGSVVVHYVEWVGNVVRGDLGTSLYSGRPIHREILERLPVSLELGLIGLAAAVLFAVPMGMAAAVMQDRWPDYVLRVYAVGMSAIPGFWLAIMIITFGSMWFRWAPPLEFAYLHEDPLAHLKIMLLPALLTGLTPSAGLMRVTRAQMLEVLRQDYIRTARAKGLGETIVMRRHALRNALIPVVTIVGLSLPGLIAGTALFEAIFVIPGMGRYLISAVTFLDYPTIQATNLMFAVIIVGSNLIVDISYGWIDPRIRVGR